MHINRPPWLIFAREDNHVGQIYSRCYSFKINRTRKSKLNAILEGPQSDVLVRTNSNCLNCIYVHRRVFIHDAKQTQSKIIYGKKGTEESRIGRCPALVYLFKLKYYNASGLFKRSCAECRMLYINKRVGRFRAVPPNRGVGHGVRRGRTWKFSYTVLMLMQTFLFNTDYAQKAMNANYWIEIISSVLRTSRLITGMNCHSKSLGVENVSRTRVLRHRCVCQ